MLAATLLAVTTAVKNFDIDLQIDRGTKSVRGIERIELASAHDLSLPLKGQSVDAVSCGEKPASFSTARSTLAVAGCTAGSVTIRYTALEPKGITFTPTVVYSAFDSCTWMICDDAPSVRAPISTTLHAPAGEWTLATGMLGSVTTEADGSRTFVWRDAQPRSAYLYGFAIGPLRSASIVDGDDALTALSADLPEGELGAVLRHSEGMAAFFEGAAGGSLPHHRYVQLIVKGSAAQEKSTFSIIGTDELSPLSHDPAEDWVIAHEMAHQFWGNSVTPESWSEMWLSEGVVTFMTAAWKEHRWGRAAYDREMELAQRRVKSAIDAGYDKPLAWSGEYPSLRLRRAIAYSRGALFMDRLRRMLGEAAFWRALRTYTATFANRTVTSRDFQRAFERSSGRNLAPLFEEWVFGGRTHASSRYRLILDQYCSRHACSVSGMRSFGTPRCVSTSSVPPSAVGVSVNAAMEKMPSGKRRWRQAWTMRRPGTRSTLMPVTSSASAENGPPTLLLIVAFFPVIAVCLRESARSS